MPGIFISIFLRGHQEAGLAQSVERQALNLMVEGSSPSFGDFFSPRKISGATINLALFEIQKLTREVAICTIVSDIIA